MLRFYERLQKTNKFLTNPRTTREKAGFKTNFVNVLYLLSVKLRSTLTSEMCSKALKLPNCKTV